MGRSLRVQKFIPGSEESNLNLTLPGLLGKDTPILTCATAGRWLSSSRRTVSRRTDPLTKTTLA